MPGVADLLITSGLGRLRPENHPKFKASLGYTVGILSQKNMGEGCCWTYSSMVAHL